MAVLRPLSLCALVLILSMGLGQATAQNRELATRNDAARAAATPRPNAVSVQAQIKAPLAAAIAVQPANVSISASTSRIIPSAPGEPITYGLTVSNGGPGMATNVSVTLFRNGQSLRASASGACTLVPCTIPRLAPGAPATLQVTQPSAGAPFLIAARVMARESGRAQPNNQATIEVAAPPSSLPPVYVPPVSAPPASTPKPQPAADLSVSVTPTTITPGSGAQLVSYTVVVGNRGPDAAANVQVSAYIGGQPQRLSADGDCNALPCAIGTLQPNASKTIRVSQPIVSPGGFAVTVRVIGQTSDPDRRNSVATVTVAAAPPPQQPQTADLAITLDPASIRIGAGTANRLATYTVTVRNDGPAVATDVWVNALAGGQTQTGSASGDCAALPCAMGAILPGETKTAAVSHWIAADGTVDISLEALGRQDDPDPNNNRTRFTVGPPTPATASSSTPGESSTPPSKTESSSEGTSSAEPAASTSPGLSSEDPTQPPLPPLPPQPPPWWLAWLPPSLIAPALGIGVALALAAAGLTAWRHQQAKLWLNRTTVTAKLGPMPDGRSGPLTFKAPPVSVTVRCALGEGGPKSAVPILKVVKHE